MKSERGGGGELVEFPSQIFDRLQLPVEVIIAGYGFIALDYFTLPNYGPWLIESEKWKGTIRTFHSQYDGVAPPTLDLLIKSSLW